MAQTATDTATVTWAAPAAGAQTSSDTVTVTWAAPAGGGKTATDTVQVTWNANNGKAASDTVTVTWAGAVTRQSYRWNGTSWDKVTRWMWDGTQFQLVAGTPPVGWGAPAPGGGTTTGGGYPGAYPGPYPPPAGTGGAPPPGAGFDLDGFDMDGWL